METMVVSPEDIAETSRSLLHELKTTILSDPVPTEETDDEATEAGPVQHASVTSTVQEQSSSNVDSQPQERNDAPQVQPASVASTVQEQSSSNVDSQPQEHINAALVQPASGASDVRRSSNVDNQPQECNDEQLSTQTKPGPSRQRRPKLAHQRLNTWLRGFTMSKDSVPSATSQFTIYDLTSWTSNVYKNESVSLVRVHALMQMAIHGNTVRAGKVLKQTKHAIKVYKRNKEICPLCDTVTMYLTTHLQRVHNNEKKSSEFVTALREARRYRGKTAEMSWDHRIIAHGYSKKDEVTVAMKRRAESDSDIEEEHVTKKRKTPLQLHAEEEELSSDLLDNTYFDESINAIPGIPRTTPVHSVTTIPFS